MEQRHVHQGRATKRIREILGIKQEELAIGLGIKQQAVSQLEAKEVFDSKVLEDVAKVLKVPVDAITRFNEDATISVIANTFTDFKDNAVASAMNYYPTFNPVDKVIELYERLLKEKDEIITELKKGK
jgi:transcriptional regulator with XRE-family HTH domain